MVFSIFLDPAQVRDNVGPVTQEEKVMALIVISVKMVRYRIRKEAQLVQIVRRARLLLSTERPVARLVRQESKRIVLVIFKVSHSALSVLLVRLVMEQVHVKIVKTAQLRQLVKALAQSVQEERLL